MIVGGIVAILNPLTGLLALIPVVGGVGILGVSCLGLIRVEDERIGYRQLAARLTEIHEGVQ